MRRTLIQFFGIFCALMALSFNAVAQKPTGTLKKIADSGVMTIGYNSDSTPFSFHDQSGSPVGYSVDLCRRIATATKAKLGLKNLEVKFVEVSLADRFDAVESGKVDIECSSSTVTLSRQERVDFTLRTFVTGGALVSKANAPVLTTGDLTGKTVAVAKNTTTQTALAEYLEQNLIDARIVSVETDAAGMKLLDEGGVQAFASDQVVLIGQIIQAGDPASYTLSQDLYSYEPYALVLRRNDADFRLVADRALARIYRTGQFKQLFERWFGTVGLRPSPVLAAMYQLEALPE
jgi:glutamate/aspartate transport system substrate-binding protein